MHDAARRGFAGATSPCLPVAAKADALPFEKAERFALEHYIYEMRQNHQHMRSSADALKIALTNVRTAVLKGKYGFAADTCLDFTQLAYWLESRTDLFIGEVLGTVCADISNVLDAYIIPEEDQIALNGNMVKRLDDLLAAYSAKEPLYDMLTSIRYEATAFQIEAGLEYPESQETGLDNGED